MQVSRAYKNQRYRYAYYRFSDTLMRLEISKIDPGRMMSIGQQLACKYQPIELYPGDGLGDPW